MFRCYAEVHHSFVPRQFFIYPDRLYQLSSSSSVQACVSDPARVVRGTPVEDSEAAKETNGLGLRRGASIILFQVCDDHCALQRILLVSRTLSLRGLPLRLRGRFFETVYYFRKPPGKVRSWVKKKRKERSEPSTPSHNVPLDNVNKHIKTIR